MKLESLYLSLILSHQKEVSFQPTSITSRNSSQIVENLLQLFEVVFHSGFDLGAPFFLNLQQLNQSGWQTRQASPHLPDHQTTKFVRETMTIDS